MSYFACSGRLRRLVRPLSQDEYRSVVGHLEGQMLSLPDGFERDQAVERANFGVGGVSEAGLEALLSAHSEA